MSVCPAAEVSTLLPEALSGRRVLAPVGESPDVTLAMLRPEVDVEFADAAAIVATSGSTGTPKGVVLSRRALLAAAEGAQGVLGPMTWTCVLPTTYVAGLMVLVRAHVAGRPVRFASSRLDDLDPAPGANAISIVPTQLFRALERPDVLAGLARYDAILLGGAAVDPALLDEARGRGLNLVTTYGMSETCGGCVWDGVPLPGVAVTLASADPTLTSAELVEAPGRIQLGGDMAFSGYRLRPDLTAQTLSGRTVRTNDRGVWADGRLQVLGRLDDVVISGGVNIDLAEVQRAVEAVCPGTGVALALPDAEWGQTITLVTTDEHDIAWWRDQLGRHLGRAALPRLLTRLDVLPRTDSGKIDRRSLIRALSDEQQG